MPIRRPTLHRTRRRSEAQLPEKSQYIHCQRVIASSLESGMTTSTYEYCRRRLSRERIVECYWFHIPLLLERCLHSKWAVHRRGTSTVRSPSTVAVDDTAQLWLISSKTPLSKEDTDRAIIHRCFPQDFKLVL